MGLQRVLSEGRREKSLGISGEECTGSFFPTQAPRPHTSLTSPVTQPQVSLQIGPDPKVGKAQGLHIPSKRLALLCQARQSPVQPATVSVAHSAPAILNLETFPGHSQHVLPRGRACAPAVASACSVFPPDSVLPSHHPSPYSFSKEHTPSTVYSIIFSLTICSLIFPQLTCHFQSV